MDGPMEDIVREHQLFRDYLLHEKRYSKHTADAYLSDIALAQHFFDDSEQTLLSVDREMLKDYLASLFHTVTPSTLQRKVAALKHFFQFCSRRNLTDINPAVNLITPRTGSSLPKFLTREEINRLISFNFPASLKGLRNRAMMELLYSSGIRVGELVTLSVRDVDFDDREIRVLGKGKKERIIPVTPEASSSLERYLLKRGARFTGKAALFCNLRGRPLTTRGAQYIISTVAKHAGIYRSVSPHMLRHSFASHFLENGINLRYLQHMLGHNNLSTTETYTHLGISELQDIYNRTFPDTAKK